MKSIRWRLVAICGLLIASVFSLVPRDVQQRAYDPASGRVHETTVRRVPIDLGLDLSGGIHLALEVDTSKADVADCADAIRRAERVVRTRTDEFGTSDAVVQVVGECRLIVELPGVTDPERARGIVQRTAFLEFRITDDDERFRHALPAIDDALGADTLSSLLRPGPIPGEFLVPEARVADVERMLYRPEVERRIPRGIELKWGTRTLPGGREPYRALYALDERAIITGEELENAVAARDPMTNAAEVRFELTRTGGRRFAEATARSIGSHLAIVLDGRVEGRPPVIQERIASSGRIELGDRSLEEANDLALILRAGALPVPLEELNAGRPLRPAVDAGFRHAMSAIVDSNVTTALTALVLYRVGTGPVQGFAVTLLVGLAASMMTAIFVMRTFFLVWLRRRRPIETLASLSGWFVPKAGFDFLRARRWAYALSGTLLLPGLLLLAAKGATYSVEFTGGTLTHVHTAEPVGTAVIRSALAQGGLTAAEVKRFGSDREYVVRARFDARDAGAARAAGDAQEVSEGQTAGERGMEATGEAVRAALDAGLGEDGYEVVRTASVTPKVGDELQQKAGVAVLVSFATTLMYLATRFEWRFGLAAVLAAGHDILASLVFIRYLDLEVSLALVAAVLTVLGYSLNDTIVVFDRVRENLRKRQGRDLSEVLDRSIVETLPRTILTSGTTLAAALVLTLFAGGVIRPFALVMSFGVVVGTFSSLFVASPSSWR